MPEDLAKDFFKTWEEGTASFVRVGRSGPWVPTAGTLACPSCSRSGQLLCTCACVPPQPTARQRG